VSTPPSRASSIMQEILMHFSLIKEHANNPEKIEFSDIDRKSLADDDTN